MELPNVYIVTNSVVFPACAVGDDEQSDWFFEGECGEGGWAFPACCPAGTQILLLSSKYQTQLHPPSYSLHGPLREVIKILYIKINI